MNGVFTSDGGDSIGYAKECTAVRRLILTATGFLCLAGGSYFLSNTWGAPKETKEPSDDPPHRVGLIDVGYIFGKYDKLRAEIDELQAEAKTERDKLSAKVQRLKELQAQMKDLTEGSPDFAELDAKYTTLGSEVETKNKVLQRQFQQKEAKLFHQAYLEVQDAVELACDRYKFTVILRFNRTDPGGTDPQRVNQLLSSQVVYHRKRDDLTDAVLKYLNDKYGKSSGGAGGGENRPLTNKPKKDAKVQGAQGTDR
jgi:Skp family chaperone for outer membrane proteins